MMWLPVHWFYDRTHGEYVATVRINGSRVEVDRRSAMEHRPDPTLPDDDPPSDDDDPPTEIGPFRLVDPTPAQAQVVADVLSLCTFPWERIMPAVHADDDGAVLIRWKSLPQGTTGSYDPWGMVINLDHPDDPHFVFAHELGHLADNESLTGVERGQLADLFHGSDGTHRRDGELLNGEEHPWSHRQSHSEDWWGGDDDYLFRLSEAFADVWVAAFVPWYARSAPRFVHHTGRLTSFRNIVLSRDI